MTRTLITLALVIAFGLALAATVVKVDGGMSTTPLLVKVIDKSSPVLVPPAVIQGGDFGASTTPLRIPGPPAR